MNRSKQLAIVLIAACAVATTVSALAEKEKTSAETSVQQIRTQKRDLLQQRVKALEQSYLSGNTTQADVFEAKGELIRAQLDLAANHSERLQILESQVQLCRGIEKVAQSHFQIGKTTHADVLQIKAHRIDAEIAFLLEKQ